MNKVIHLSTSADLTSYTYSQVYCGITGTITLNGISVTMDAGSTIDLIVTEVTGGTGIYLLGRKTINLPQIL